jgi:hypothetical protein
MDNKKPAYSGHVEQYYYYCILYIIVVCTSQLKQYYLFYYYYPEALIQGYFPLLTSNNTGLTR